MYVAVANFPEGLLNDFRGAAQCPVDRPWVMVRAALLRRSCDGVATATAGHAKWA